MLQFNCFLFRVSLLSSPSALVADFGKSPFAVKPLQKAADLEILKLLQRFEDGYG